MAPISSLRSTPGISQETSPPASCDIVAVRSTIGWQTRRRTMITRPMLAVATAMQPGERDQEADARGRTGRVEDLFGVGVEGVAQLDDRAETLLRLHEKGVCVVLVFARDGAFLGQLQLLAEAPDIGLVHLLERRRDVGGRRRIAAQLLQRHQDLVGPALGAAELHLFGFGRDALGTDEVLVDARVVAADVAQRPGDVGVARLPVGVAVEQGHLADLLVEQRGDGGIEDGVIGDDLPGGVLAGLGRTVDRLVDGVAKCCEFRVQRIDCAAYGGAIVERPGQVFADRVHLVARAVGLLAVFVVEFRARLRIHDGRARTGCWWRSRARDSYSAEFRRRPGRSQAGAARRKPCP